MATEKFFVFNEDGALKRLKGRIVRYLDNEDPTGSDKSAIRTSLEVSPDAAGLVQADVGTAPNEIPVNGMLGDMAYQSSDGVSMGVVEADQVGIGNSSPSSYNADADDLVIGDGSGARGITISSSDLSTGNIFFGDLTSGATARGAVTYDHFTNALSFKTAASTRAVIDSSGRVGINQTSPGSMFSGANNLVIGNHSAANQGMTIASGSSNYGLIYFSDTTAGTGLYRGSVYYNHNLDTLGFSSAGTTQWSINSSGNLVAGTGNGIDFGSGATLDDYEEGEHTCVIVTGGGSITLNGTNNKLAYTKVGNLVTVTGVLQIASVSSPTGSCVLSVPFAAASGAKHRAAGSVYVTPAVSNPIGDFSLRLTEGTDDLFIHLNTGTSTADAAAQMQANTYISVGITYITT